MTALIHAELLKLRTSRTFWWTVLAAVAFVPVSIALAIHNAGENGTPVLDSVDGVRNVMAAAASGAMVLLVIGIMIVAGEHRHGTATSTFLVSPDRARVVWAKLAAGSLVGVAVACATSLVTLATALPWLSARDVDVATYAGDVAFALAGAVLATALAPLLGVGIGALVRNQTLAVTIVLVWSFTVESLLVSFVPELGRWLPTGAESAMTGVATANGGMLPVWAGALVFTGYALAFAAAGTRLVRRRDVV
jgi:ABC-2 type transport system permease protein